MDSRLENLDNALGAVEEYLDVLTTKPVDELTTELAPIDKAKVQVGLVQGVSSKDGRQTQVKQELDRVKGYIQKIKYSEEMGTQASCIYSRHCAPKYDDIAAAALAKGRQIRVDAEAAGRFINHALSSDQVYAEAAAATTDAKAGDSAKKAPSTKKKNKASDKSTAAKSTTDTPPKKRARK
ncbi:hypothetical protein DYB37_009577 [Aphanomyces astaci]|uniref:Nuclear nucleic acid-binding protein C1D n=1 Tax=Aphanomyces astaci TaxID=112090 RepID=A0A418EEQ4_APHAT|nr:hypothetical protein DYB35_007131 [Aphanomyces astaci]RHZ11942.1 hypothetical protein DYB37_009577 [Aphanomyces astaci]